METEKKKELLILAFFFQLFLIIISNVYRLVYVMSFKLLGMSANLISLLNILSVLITVYLVTNVLKLTKKEQELFLLKKEQKHNENLSAFIRELKHDLNNQLFVVNGMLQLGKAEEAAAYANELNEQFVWMEDLLALNQPELSALILNKLLEAKNLGIDVQANISANKTPELSVDIFTRTLGNILDNAVDELRNKKEDRKIIIDMYNDIGTLKVIVKNSGDISTEIAEKMFKRGFTTKIENKGHGLGLHIVSSLMHSIGGSVNHSNREGMAVFELTYPIKAV